MPRQRVCVGVDGSAASFRALEAAAAAAERRDAALEVVCCENAQDDGGWAVPVLHAAADHLARRHPGLTVATSAVPGDPLDVLTGRTETAALTVIGSRGLGGFAGLLAHSLGRRLVARTHGPLLVVRDPGPHVPAPPAAEAGARTAPGARRCVLLAVENDQDAEAALFAFAEAEALKVPVHVLHTRTYRPQRPRDGEGGPRQAERALLAGAASADLVVLAAHPRRAAGIGSVATVLLQHARCPVAVVPCASRPARRE